VVETTQTGEVKRPANFFAASLPADADDTSSCASPLTEDPACMQPDADSKKRKFEDVFMDRLMHMQAETTTLILEGTQRLQQQMQNQMINWMRELQAMSAQREDRLLDLVSRIVEDRCVRGHHSSSSPSDPPQARAAAQQLPPSTATVSSAAAPPMADVHLPRLPPTHLSARPLGASTVFASLPAVPSHTKTASTSVGLISAAGKAGENKRARTTKGRSAKDARMESG